MLNIANTAAVDVGWGVVRLFGTCDIGDYGLGQGWAPPEPSHIWNDGPDATLHLLLRGEPRRAKLSIDGMPFIRPGQPRQEITLYVNGFRLGFWRLLEPKIGTLSAMIAPEQMFMRGENCVLDCTFHIPTCARPMDLGEGGDRRELGFCFQTVVVADTSAFLGQS
jgi:hypothetical protein